MGNTSKSTKLVRRKRTINKHITKSITKPIPKHISSTKSKTKSGSVSKSKRVVDKRTLKTKYFDTHLSIRISKEMVKLMDFWISNPKCVDDAGIPLFSNRSHFCKSSLIKLFNELKFRYPTI